LVWLAVDKEDKASIQLSAFLIISKAIANPRLTQPLRGIWLLYYTVSMQIVLKIHILNNFQTVKYCNNVS